MEQNKKSNFIVKFFSNPIVGAIGSIASIIGIPLAFYLASKESPQLTYYVNPAKAVVVKSGQASRLTASFDNKIIETDITASQIAIWNQGTKAIKKDNVLKPIVIYTENETPILEATLRKTNREVTGIALDTNELQKGKLILSWNILEHNDGAVIQLIYAGGSNIKIEAEGIIEQQGQIKKLENTNIKDSTNEKSISYDSGYKSLGKTFLIISAIMILFYLVNRRMDNKNSRSLLEHQQKLENLKGEELEEYVKEIEQSLTKGKRILNIMNKIESIVGFIAFFVLFSLGIYFVFFSDEIVPLYCPPLRQNGLVESILSKMRIYINEKTTMDI